MAIGCPAVSEGSKHSLRTIALAEFGTSDVTTQADPSGVVTLKDLKDLPQGVTRVTYRGPKFAEGGSEEGGLIGIEGLIQNQDYDIVKADGNDQYYLRPVTTLTTAIDDKPTTTTVAVDDVSIFPLLNAVDPTKDSFPFNILIGGEEMKVVSRSGNDLTVVRGVNGTTNAKHAMDAFVSTSSYAKFHVPELTDAQKTQMHAFAYTAHRQEFEPLAENVVDPKANTIKLKEGHGFKTGDFVIYETDDEQTVEKEVYSYDKGGKRQLSLGKVKVPDAPIDGLEDYRGYRVIVDPVDPTLIRLSKQIQMEKVEKDGSTKYYPVADTVVLNSTPVTGNHRLVPVSLVQGINISSSLEAENSSEAGTKLSDEEQPPSELVSQTLAGDITTSGMALIDGLREKATENAVDGAADKAQTASGSRTNFDVAGSFALNIFQHDVATTIGSSAILSSTSDLTVDGKIEQSTD